MQWQVKVRCFWCWKGSFNPPACAEDTGLSRPHLDDLSCHLLGEVLDDARCLAIISQPR